MAADVRTSASRLAPTKGEEPAMSRLEICTQWLRVVLGLLVFAFGVHLTIFANIGLAPWDCLGMGIAAHTPLNYGLAMTAMSVAILVVDLAMGEQIGYGTIIDALLTGNFVQLFNDLNPLPLNQSPLAGVAIMTVGFVFMAVGMWIYMRAAQGCGPRDALLVGLGKRLPQLPIGVVQVLLWSGVTLVGWLLGGPVGIGTLLSAFGAGLVAQAVYAVLHFEPRDVRHRGVVEVTQQLMGWS